MFLAALQCLVVGEGVLEVRLSSCMLTQAVSP